MSKLFAAVQTKDSRTENGAVTHSTSGDKCVDLFFKIGASRGRAEQVWTDFILALGEDYEVATRILLWSRDVRGGAGERQIFRHCMTELVNHGSYDKLIKRIMVRIPELGRWDDLFIFEGTRFEKDAVHMVLAGLNDESTAGLVAKWMPRKKGFFNLIRRELGVSPKELRKFLVETSNTVEQKMSAKDYSAIDYSKVPSLAAARLQKAFERNDAKRYSEYTQKLVKAVAENTNEVKINSGAVYPYDVLKSVKRGNVSVADAQWKSLPNFMEGVNENIIVMCDVSSSMTWEKHGDVDALEIGLSLGMYVAERNTGIFKDQVMCFSGRPYFKDLGSATSLKDKMRIMMQDVYYGSTNLQGAFEAILKAGVDHGLSQEDMPTKVIIFSDMEFNQGANYGSTNHQQIKAKYRQYGYEMPQIVYWNLAARNRSNSPVKTGSNGVALVSGFSPSLMTSIVGGKTISPYEVMMNAVGGDRYNF